MLGDHRLFHLCYLKSNSDSVCLCSLHLSLSLTVCLSVCLSLCLPVSQALSSSVCLSISHSLFEYSVVQSPDTACPNTICTHTGDPSSGTIIPLWAYLCYCHVTICTSHK